jgi:hypothetical protein
MLGLSEQPRWWEATVKKSYAAQRQFVGVDLARRRSVIARMDPGGEVVDCVQIDNSERDLVAEVAKAGPGAPVAVEATFGWYWAVDVLQAAGHEVHLAHPKGNASMHNRRAKTDARDAAELARLLRMGDLAESWIASPVVRARRELVRHRHKLVKTRASLKASVHAVLGKCGIVLPLDDIFAPGRAGSLGGGGAGRAVRLAGGLAVPADRGGHHRGHPGRGGDRRGVRLRPRLPGTVDDQGDRAGVRVGVRRRDR